MRDRATTGIDIPYTIDHKYGKGAEALVADNF